MSEPVVQIYGTKKCPDTRKAERWFKERGRKVQSIDLNEKGLSPGELKSVARAVGGAAQLIDKAGRRYENKGLRHADVQDERAAALLLEDALLLRTPVVRRASAATVGFRPEVWELWK
jgi:arsenate reductase